MIKKVIIVITLICQVNIICAPKSSGQSFAESIAAPADNIKVSRRPPLADRMFTSETIEKKIKEISHDYLLEPGNDNMPNIIVFYESLNNR